MGEINVEWDEEMGNFTVVENSDGEEWSLSMITLDFDEEERAEDFGHLIYPWMPYNYFLFLEDNQNEEQHSSELGGLEYINCIFTDFLQDKSLKGLLSCWNISWHTQGNVSECKRLRDGELSKFLERLEPHEEFYLQRFFLKLLEAQEAKSKEGFIRIAEQVIHAVRTILLVNDDLRVCLIDLLCSSTTSCVDKPVAALCHVELWHQILLARGSLEAMKLVGQKVMYMDEIVKAATELERNGEDFTSCLMKLVISLKDILHLPFSVTTVRYTSDFAADSAETVARTCLDITDEEFHNWLENWSEWQREKRRLVLCKIDWSDLEILATEESSIKMGTVYNLCGERCSDPVLVGSTWWSWADFSKHWLETGRDMYNSLIRNDQINLIHRMAIKCDEPLKRNKVVQTTLIQD